jgi:hypothetical protein
MLLNGAEDLAGAANGNATSQTLMQHS